MNTLLGLLLTLLSLGAATTAAHAAPPSYLDLEAAYTTVANGWDRVDRYLDTTSGFHAEQYPEYLAARAEDQKEPPATGEPVKRRRFVQWRGSR
ncbi:hypothetical protein ACIBBE_45980 [Streptomyces sp. NPDC051644]|uniref:hypothetical protein n=1 Tax=Streptomyces sp. NPDC051644 TaxID=3365666 RepID=UPI00379DD3F7